MKEEIIVSIWCLAYNHEKYIKDALEGFLKQKTNFKFEVIVHEDCSTDNTAQIIKEYEEKYPNIIKLIYQTENQYSKGINSFRTFGFPRMKGKYVAFCEGDDFWVDENKLQKQVDYMESHPDCTFCFTNGYKNDLLLNKKYDFMEHYNGKGFKEDKDFNLVDMLKLDFIPTCSFLFPLKCVSQMPEYYNERCFAGDRRMALYYTAIGYAHYISEKTCNYNFGVANSALTKKKTKEQLSRISDERINMCCNLDKFTNKAYHAEIFYYIQQIEIDRLYNDYNNLIKLKYYKNIYKIAPFKIKVKLFLEKYLKWVLIIKRKFIK